MLSITLDWLAFTFKEDTHEAGEWIRLYASDKTNVSVTARNGYRDAYQTQTGVVVQWNVDREEMGYHVVIAGSAIRNVLEHYELDQKTLIQTVLHAGASITRLDVAKDLQGVAISLDAIYEALEQRQYIGTARKFAQIHSIGGGNTIYVGSRQSEKFMRIYDKAAELQAPGTLWYRLELETKGMVARSLATELVTGDNWTSRFDGIARHMVDVAKGRDWQEFFVPGDVPTGIPKLEKQTDREAWIEAQVMPAVVKHFIEHRDSKAVALLRAMLDQIDAMGTVSQVDTIGE